VSHDPQRRRRWAASFALSLFLHALVVAFFVVLAVDLVGDSTEIAQPGDVTLVHAELETTAPPTVPATPGPAFPVPSVALPRSPRPQPVAPALLATTAREARTTVEPQSRHQPPRRTLPAAPRPELARNVPGAEPQPRSLPTPSQVASVAPVAPAIPSEAPAPVPSMPELAPSVSAPPAVAPIAVASPVPSVIPTAAAPGRPLAEAAASAAPVVAATAAPTIPPTPLPTAPPTVRPTLEPSVPPTVPPTHAPEATQPPPAPPAPSTAPTNQPNVAPTNPPTLAPTVAWPVPSAAPTRAPTAAPSGAPTAVPTAAGFVATPAPSVPSPAGVARVNTVEPASGTTATAASPGGHAPGAAARPGATGPGSPAGQGGGGGGLAAPHAGARGVPGASVGSAPGSPGTGPTTTLNDRLKALSAGGAVDYRPKRIAIGDAQAVLDNAVAAYEARLAPPPEILRATFGFIYQRRTNGNPDSLAYVYDRYSIGPVTICKAWKIVEHPYTVVPEVGSVAGNAGIGGAVASNANSPNVRHDMGGAAEIETIQFPCTERSYTAVPRGSITTPLPRHPDIRSAARGQAATVSQSTGSLGPNSPVPASSTMP
jgi:hypothetical protein